MELTRPEDVGVDSGVLDHIAPRMESYVDTGRIPGHAVLVARHGKVAYDECFGSADLERGIPLGRDAIYRVFSMTKPITIVAAMILYERGLFGLNDPIFDYIPEFKDMNVLGENGDVVNAVRPVTIGQLMTHTSGISYDGGGTTTESAYKELRRLEEEGDPTSEEFISALTDIPLLFQPGDHWHYGYSTDVIGRLVEVLSGKRLGRFMQDEIFQPLGMVDSGFLVTGDQKERLTSLYEPLDSTSRSKPDNLKLSDYPSEGWWLRPHHFDSGGGGLTSTTQDYALFAQMLANGGTLNGQRILGPKTVALIASDHLTKQHKRDYDWEDHRGYTFGLGVRVMENPADGGSNGSVGEYGWAGMAGTWVWIDPKEDLVALYMVQLNPDCYYPAAREFIHMVYSAIQ